MAEKPASSTRWLRIRNLIVGYAAICFGLGAIYWGLNSVWNLFWMMPLWYVCLSLWQGMQVVHPRRLGLIKRATPAMFDLEYEEIHFQASDGLKLCGYFLKGVRSEAIILSHGLGGGGVTMCPPARALQRAGYNVLMYDMRGHGRSEGDTVDGVHEVSDILGAVEWLRSRPGIAAERIGGLGVSLGAHALLHAALETGSIRAIVLEGLGPNCIEDHGGRPTTWRRWINYPFNWFNYKIADFIANTRPESNTSALKRLNRPVLMISTGHRAEQHFMRLLFAAASEPKELWELPKAHHAGGFIENPQEYGEKMVKFFNASLT